MTDKTKTHAGGEDASHPGRVLAFWDTGFASADLPVQGALTLGRAPECDLRIEHDSVSRHHALLHVDGGFRIEDLGSSNGTRIAGRRLAPNAPTVVSEGELVELGGVGLLLKRPRESATPAGASTAPAASHSGSASAPLEGSMVQLRRLLELVAPSHLSVVLLGETGAGKEVAAQLIHERSRRSRGPLVTINCAAMPEALLESELFGYERGAFTGAVQAKPGLLEAAHGGTLFLDEVADLPLAAQAKLLRVLETHQVTRLGSVTARAIDVRFVAATHRDLEARVAAGAFRQDTYFRLNGVSITIPPLRERQSEIASLAASFVEDAARRMNRAPPVIEQSALAALERYHWPGNVRELRNVLERALVFCTGDTISLLDLPPAISASSSAGAPHGSGTLRSELDAIEHRRIVEALDQCGGHQGRAAKLLGISRRTLVSRLDQFALPRPRKTRTDRR